LEPHGVQHSGGSLAKAWRRGAFHGFEGESFDDYPAKTIEVYQVGKFDAVAEGSAGYENGIPKAHRANLHGQVNGDCGGHFAEKNSMNTPLQTMISKLDSKQALGIVFLRSSFWFLLNGTDLSAILFF
jgi:hypothetical protein